MLRNVVITVGAAMLLSGILALLSGRFEIAIICLVWGAILVFGIIYERYAYKKVVDAVPPGNGWTRTPERFRDDSSGRIVTVWVKPLTGERAYVADRTPPAAGEG